MGARLANVLYGIDQCHTASSPPESHLLPLPMKVSAIPSDLIGTTTYSAHAALVTYDVAYDLWLNKSGTKKACRTNGTLEVMVWTDYDARALLPGSMEVGTASIPFAINGVVKSGKQAWAIYASNVYGNGQTAPWGGTVWLVLNQAETVSNGAVSVDLSSALSAVGTLLEHNYGWHDFRKTYWLDALPFGIEYGPENGSLTRCRILVLFVEAFFLLPRCRYQFARRVVEGTRCSDRSDWRPSWRSASVTLPVGEPDRSSANEVTTALGNASLVSTVVKLPFVAALPVRRVSPKIRFPVPPSSSTASTRRAKRCRIRDRGDADDSWDNSTGVTRSATSCSRQVLRNRPLRCFKVTAVLAKGPTALSVSG